MTFVSTKSADERFDAKWTPEPNTGCHLWMACTVWNGYGTFHVGKGKRAFAHRFAYERAFGPIPPGLQLDHLCRTRSCVNPRHLEVVTNRENMFRSPITLARRCSDKTHCPKDHPYTGYNLVIQPSNGARRCRICMNAVNLRRRRARGVRSRVSLVGTASPNSRLCIDDVTEIRRRLASGVSGPLIAKDFGISVSTVSNIRLGRGAGRNVA